MEEFVMREDNFHEGGAEYSSTIKKTMKKLIWKGFFK